MGEHGVYEDNGTALGAEPRPHREEVPDTRAVLLGNPVRRHHIEDPSDCPTLYHVTFEVTEECRPERRVAGHANAVHKSRQRLEPIANIVEIGEGRRLVYRVAENHLLGVLTL